MEIESLHRLIDGVDDQDETPTHLRHLTDVRALGTFVSRFDTEEPAEERRFYRGLNARKNYVYFFTIECVRYGISKEHLDYYWYEK